MDLKILQKIEEPLLSRIKVEFEITFENSTPSGNEVKTKIAKDLGKDEKLIDIKGIYTLYGLKKAKVLCYAYENEEILKRIKIKKKKKDKKEEAQQEKQETKKEEKPEAKLEKKEAKEEKKETKQEKQKDKKPEKKKQ